MLATWAVDFKTGVIMFFNKVVANIWAFVHIVTVPILLVWYNFMNSYKPSNVIIVYRCNIANPCYTFFLFPVSVNLRQNIHHSNCQFTSNCSFCLHQLALPNITFLCDLNIAVFVHTQRLQDCWCPPCPPALIHV